MTVAEIQSAFLTRGYDLGPSGADGDAGARIIAAVTPFPARGQGCRRRVAGPKPPSAIALNLNVAVKWR